MGVGGELRDLGPMRRNGPARDIGERKIDVAADYREAFERAERTERELHFLEAVTEYIDRARNLREMLSDTDQLLQDDIPAVWHAAHRGVSLLENCSSKFDDQLADVERLRRQIHADWEDLSEKSGLTKAKLETCESSRRELDELHDKWTVYSPEMIHEMRRGNAECNRRIVQLEDDLQSVERIDPNIVRRRNEERRQSHLRDRAMLANWNRTVVAKLLESGVSMQEAERRGGIATVTLNPTIDVSAEAKQVVPDAKLRCARPKFEPGGGGLNVSRAIRKMNGDSVALWTRGGHIGEHLADLLADDGIASQSIPVEGMTRENLIVHEQSADQQFRFCMPGPQLSEAEVDYRIGSDDSTQFRCDLLRHGCPPGVGCRPHVVLFTLLLPLQREGVRKEIGIVLMFNDECPELFR